MLKLIKIAKLKALRSGQALSMFFLLQTAEVERCVVHVMVMKVIKIIIIVQ